MAGVGLRRDASRSVGGGATGRVDARRQTRRSKPIPPTRPFRRVRSIYVATVARG